jgi:hypothetical protein
VLNIGGSIGMWVKDAVSMSEGTTHTYKFGIPRADEGIKAFKVTITWTDPYTSATSGADGIIRASSSSSSSCSPPSSSSSFITATRGTKLDLNVGSQCNVCTTQTYGPPPT